jgi:hypothetical protein
MVRSLPALALIAALALGLAAPQPALAVFPPAIKDDGKFFAKETLEKANKKIRELYQKYKKDVVIETFESLPEEQQKKFDGLKDDAAKDRFFVELAQKRSQELGVNGLYIVIYKKPRRFETYVDADSGKVFTEAKRKALFNKFAASVKAKNMDDALLAVLEEVETDLKGGKKK